MRGSATSRRPPRPALLPPESLPGIRAWTPPGPSLVPPALGAGVAERGGWRRPQSPRPGAGARLQPLVPTVGGFPEPGSTNFSAAWNPMENRSQIGFAGQCRAQETWTTNRPRAARELFLREHFYSFSKMTQVSTTWAAANFGGQTLAREGWGCTQHRGLCGAHQGPPRRPEAPWLSRGLVCVLGSPLFTLPLRSLL